MGQSANEAAGNALTMNREALKPAPTVVAMHDLSGVGRCALTVAIPVLAAMGVQPIPAPTAVLSAHTAFPEFVSRDLTEYLADCLNEWLRMGLRFDCVYTGYMATARQAEIARRFLEGQSGALIVVDPVLGDDGRMYRALPEEMPAAMRRLCAHADLITPNLTEAALLTETEYGGDAIDEAELERMLIRLRALGAKTALITGVALKNSRAEACVRREETDLPLGTRVSDPGLRHVNAWMGADGRVRMQAYDPVPAAFPGTGDLFASVVVGASARGRSLEEAIAIATEYTRLAMLHTKACGTEPVYGVQLEQTLGELIKMMER